MALAVTTIKSSSGYLLGSLMLTVLCMLCCPWENAVTPLEPPNFLYEKYFQSRVCHSCNCLKTPWSLLLQSNMGKERGEW